MRSRLILPVLLLLTALQAVGPLLHAHRDAREFGGGLHLPGITVLAAPSSDASSVGAFTLEAPAPALRGDATALVTAADGIDGHGVLAPVAAAPATAALAAPVREGRGARPPPTFAAIPGPRHLRPAPQAPPRA
jgi:hypothetical protein